MDKLMWFLIGALGGWLVIWIFMYFGATLIALIMPVLIIVAPFAVLVWAMWFVLFRKA